MKKIVVVFMTVFFAVVNTVLSQNAGKEVYVVVSPDHEDWIYKVGETATFTVMVLKSQTIMRNAVVDYEFGPEFYPEKSEKGKVLKDGIMKISGTMNKPGFLRFIVNAHDGDHQYRGLGTAAFDPDNIQPSTTMPDDFEEFWEKSLKDARQIPLAPKMTLLPERCTQTDNVYQVSYNTERFGGRFYGILSVPKASGKYPALLRLPGAGCRPYKGDTYTAQGKIITLEIGIHGLPVNLDPEVYESLINGSLNNYWRYGLQDRKSSYYHHVICGAARSVDFIYSLPEFDGKKLVASGGSQGGALSIITAALDPRISYITVAHPALCDHHASLENRAPGWPQYFFGDKNPDKNMLETARYYDVVNFARLLKTPGWYTWGFNDTVCPPTSFYAAFNVIKAPKKKSVYLETEHFTFPSQWDEWLEEIRNQLK